MGLLLRYGETRLRSQGKGGSGETWLAGPLREVRMYMSRGEKERRARRRGGDMVRGRCEWRKRSFRFRFFGEGDNRSGIIVF